MPVRLCQQPVSCVRAGTSSGAPCQQHCPKAAWQQSRQAGHGSGSPPGPPEPCLVLAAGLMASEMCQSSKGYVLCLLALSQSLEGTGKAACCTGRACSAHPLPQGLSFLKNAPNPPGRLKMSASRGNGRVCQICLLFISREFNYISQLVNFE